MDVLAGGERLAELRLAGHVRQDPQLDLRVVGGEEPEAGLGDEGASDLPPQLGADRNGQVRVRGRQAPRGGDGLVEVGVQPAVLGEIRLGSGSR